MAHERQREGQGNQLNINALKHTPALAYALGKHQYCVGCVGESVWETQDGEESFSSVEEDNGIEPPNPQIPGMVEG